MSSIFEIFEGLKGMQEKMAFIWIKPLIAVAVVGFLYLLYKFIKSRYSSDDNEYN